MILFAGSSSGAGKSTLSNYLFRQLAAQDIRARWLYEEDLLHLPAFAHFRRDLTTSYPQPVHLLLAAAALAQECGDDVTIVDSFLPGYHFFFGVHPRAQIERYSLDLLDTLRPRRPLIIYLKTDIAIAYARAVEQRGSLWLERMIRRMNRWHLPLYNRKPFRSLADVIAFDQVIDELSRSLLVEWSDHALVLDTTSAPIAQLQTTILAHLGLSECNVEHPVPHELLARYAGTYSASDGTAQPPQLEITLTNTTLILHTYWSNGTPLVAASNSRFQLEATSRWIEFAMQESADVCGLTYWVGQKPYRYIREAQERRRT